MSVEKRIAAFLELALTDVAAGELLLAGGNRYAAYHAQQAIEKLTKGVLLKKGIESGVEHRLEELFRRLPPDDSWQLRLRPFAGYSAYATAFRYPTPGGRIPGEPTADSLRTDLARIRQLVASSC